MSRALAEGEVWDNGHTPVLVAIQAKSTATSTNPGLKKDWAKLTRQTDLARLGFLKTKFQGVTVNVGLAVGKRIGQSKRRLSSAQTFSPARPAASQTYESRSRRPLRTSPRVLGPRLPWMR